MSVSSLAQVRLGPLLLNSDGSRAYVPQPDSPVLDRIGCAPGFDQRGARRPIDANGDGTVLCDTGAIERQLTENSDVMFANGFENL